MRLRHVPVATWNTWGSVLTPIVRSMSPETTRTSPLARTVVVGYQRPAFMSGKVVPRVIEGVICAGPRQPHVIRDVAAGYEELAVSQERVAAAEEVVTRLAEARSCSRWRDPRTADRCRTRPPSPGQIITFPVGSMWVWTGKKGQLRRDGRTTAR